MDFNLPKFEKVRLGSCLGLAVDWFWRRRERSGRSDRSNASCGVGFAIGLPGESTANEDWSLAERVGFEPTDPRGSTVFKTAAIDRSATSPDRDRL